MRSEGRQRAKARQREKRLVTSRFHYDNVSLRQTYVLKPTHTRVSVSANIILYLYAPALIIHGIFNILRETSSVESRCFNVSDV